MRPRVSQRPAWRPRANAAPRAQLHCCWCCRCSLQRQRQRIRTRRGDRASTSGACPSESPSARWPRSPRSAAWSACPDARPAAACASDAAHSSASASAPAVWMVSRLQALATARADTAAFATVAAAAADHRKLLAKARRLVARVRGWRERCSSCGDCAPARRPAARLRALDQSTVDASAADSSQRHRLRCRSADPAAQAADASATADVMPDAVRALSSATAGAEAPDAGARSCAAAAWL